MSYFITSRWCSKIAAHIYSTQNAGDGGEEDAEYSKPGDSILIFWPKIFDEVATAPAVKAFTWICNKRSNHKVERGQKKNHEQRELQFHYPFNSGYINRP